MPQWCWVWSCELKIVFIVIVTTVHLLLTCFMFYFSAMKQSLSSFLFYEWYCGRRLGLVIYCNVFSHCYYFLMLRFLGCMSRLLCGCCRFFILLMYSVFLYIKILYIAFQKKSFNKINYINCILTLAYFFIKMKI